ncbi:hypothetical protein [Nitrosopumilus ureiphilus]|uniref:hypothetical protein n=1 Tax=Nitrosopumilus ureiphilus TaxID=1470067 RepID=UPI0015CD3E74
MNELTSLQKPNLLVRYQFNDDEEITHVWLTQSQYENFRILPIVKFCEIVES